MAINFLKNIDWVSFWEITKHYILPNVGTIIINVILFFLLTLIIAISYISILSRKKVFKRTPKYYNWAVKLYIPLLLIGIIYTGIQFGVIRGTYKILDNNRLSIVNNIYNTTAHQFFANEKEKQSFIQVISQLASKSQQSSKLLSQSFAKKMKQIHTGNTNVDNVKNNLTNYLINNYGDEIYSLSMYGLILAALPHADLTESLPYEEFREAIKVLLATDVKYIEASITKTLDQWCHELLVSKYWVMIILTIILLLTIMAIPLIEFFIYKKWIEKKTVIN